jgi:hypothetical protein
MTLTDGVELLLVLLLELLLALFPASPVTMRFP